MVRGDATISVLFVVFLDEAACTAVDCGQADAECNLL